MVQTHAAVEAVHGHLMDIVRLRRSDNTGIREPVPALALRLGKDQECYDFCKWWATIGDDGHYNWGNISLPYLDIKNADVFESPRKHYVREFGSLSHTAAIALLKIRLLIDVHTLQNSSVISHKVPREIFNSVRGQLVSSSVVAENKDIMNSHDQVSLIKNLEVQVQDLYAAVKNLNQYFWPVLLNLGEHLHPRSETWNCGTFEQVRVVLQHSYDAWMETPGAADVIRELVKRDI